MFGFLAAMRFTALFYTSIPEVLELFLNQGACINHQSKIGKTVLHHHVKHRNNDCVDFLLKPGIEWNIRNIFGESVLHTAALRYNVGALKLLLKNFNSDINKHLDKRGNTCCIFS